MRWAGIVSRTISRRGDGAAPKPRDLPDRPLRKPSTTAVGLRFRSSHGRARPCPAKRRLPRLDCRSPCGPPPAQNVLHGHRDWRQGALPDRHGLPPASYPRLGTRSEERRGGKEGGRTGRSRWSPYLQKKKQKKKKV